MRAHWLITLCLVWANFVQSKRKLYILGLIPESGTKWTEPFARYSAELALSHIRQNGSVLSDYELEIDWQNTECDGGTALKGFVDSLANSKTYVAVFGGGCAVATSQVAALSHKYGLAQIGYASTAPNLGDAKLFPRFVRGVPSDINAVPARAKFIVDNNWKRVAIINEQDPIFVASSHGMEILLGNLNIEYRVEDFAADSKFPLNISVSRIANNLIDNGYRIIIANMYEDAAVKLFCKLSQNPEYALLLPPHSTWMFLGWFTDNWHNKSEILDQIHCKESDVIRASNGVLGFLVAHSNRRFIGMDSEVWTEYGYTVRELYEMYRSLTLSQINNDVTVFDDTSDVHEAYVYDSLWSLALSLDYVSNQFNLTEISSRSVFQDQEFFGSDSEFSRAVYEGMLGFQFEGWSGRIRFIGHERFDDRVQLLEFIDGRLEFRAEFSNIPTDSTGTDFSNISGFDANEIIFSFWNASRSTDGIFDLYVHPAITGLVDILSIIIACYITFYIVVIVVGRIQKVNSILNTSPTLTCSILGGNYLLLLAGILIVSNDYIIAGSSNHLIEFRYNATNEDPATQVCDTPLCSFFCMFPITLLLTATSIIFGGMIGKAAIIYLSAVRINFTSRKKLNKSMVIAWPYLLASLDVVFVLIWSFVGPLVLKKEVLRSGLSDPPFYRVIQCQSSVENDTETKVFITILLLYKTVLVLIGIVMGYNLRNVKKKSLKYWSTITWTMYNMATYALVFVLAVFLIEEHNAKLAVLGFLTLINVVLTTTITGLPPAYFRFKDPSLEKERMKGAGNAGHLTDDLSMLRRRCNSLQKDKEDLECKVSDYERRASILTTDSPSPMPRINEETLIFNNNNINNN